MRLSQALIRSNIRPGERTIGSIVLPSPPWINVATCRFSSAFMIILLCLWSLCFSVWYMAIPVNTHVAPLRGAITSILWNYLCQTLLLNGAHIQFCLSQTFFSPVQWLASDLYKFENANFSLSFRRLGAPVISGTISVNHTTLDARRGKEILTSGSPLFPSATTVRIKKQML